MRDASISAAGLRIMRLLVGNPPHSVSDLIRATGVTRTAVTEQLNELVAAGLVERDTQRLESRGRPKHLYKATDAALLKLFAGQQRTLLPIIWQAIDEVGGEELAGKILRRVSQAMAEHYAGKITAKKPHERLRQFSELLSSEGALLDVTDDGNDRVTLYRRSCPFVGLFDSRRNVCGIDLAVLSDVVGREVRQTACRHDGSPCCTFELARPGANGG